MRSQRLAEGRAAPDRGPNQLAIAIAREPAALPGEQDADLFEKLAYRGGGDRVSPFEIFVVDDATWEHVRAWRAVGSAGPAHEQPLPRLLAAHEKHGR